MTATGITMGIAAEFNPFHKGHRYLLEKASQIAENIVIVMSGNYVQRGAPAITAERYRVYSAMQCGADLVIEIPVRYATASAPYFSMAAVKLLDSLQCCDKMLFGSELPVNELESRDIGHQKKEDAQSDILPSNAILARQYIKALRAAGSRIQPVRFDLSESPEKISASELRNIILNGGGSDALEHMDKNATDPELVRVKMKMNMSAFDEMLFYKLADELREGGAEKLAQYCDVDHDLAERIAEHIKEYTGALQFTEVLKHKAVAYSRVSRALLHILLGIKKNAEELDGEFSPELIADPQYIRVLGLKKKKSFLLKNTRLPVITKIARAERYRDLSEEIYASFLYGKAAFMKYGIRMPDIYMTPVII